MSQARAAVIVAAKGLHSGDLPFIEAVRTISAQRFCVPGALDSPDFVLFAAIDSETDHLPTAQMRAQCSASCLEACDREEAAVAAAHADAVSAACDGILLLLDEPS